MKRKNYSKFRLVALPESEVSEDLKKKAAKALKLRKIDLISI